MAEAIAGMFIVFSVLPLLLVFLIGLGVAYVSLRIRDARADPPDPELGIKSGYYFFLTASMFLALSGLTISVIDLADEALGDKPVPGAQAQGPQFNPPGQFRPQPVRRDDPFESVSQRVAWPLVIPGAPFSLSESCSSRPGPTTPGSRPCAGPLWECAWPCPGCSSCLA